MHASCARSQDGPLALKARYVFPIDGPPLSNGPISDGIVTIDRQKILAVGKVTEASNQIELGNVALIPGLVNAHTHLEFSDLHQPLGRPLMAFPDWIRAVIDHRRNNDVSPNDVIRQGIEECARYGTTTLGEIATPGWPEEIFENLPLEATVFLELLGLASERAEELKEWADEHVQRAASSGGCWYAGLSPHAPYSVRTSIVRDVCQEHSRVPIAMHLAESREELELLRSGTGDFYDLLVELDRWDSSALKPNTRPLDSLKMLSQASRSLVIHGNYLDDEEHQYLAEHAEMMSVIYCPRTHDYFGHDKYPLAKLLDLGVCVALGTDSRASNPDLSLLEEMRFVARRHSDVSPETILRLGTLGGAKALGREKKLGTLAPGKLANFAVVALPETDARDPHELLLNSDGQIISTWHQGQMVYNIQEQRPAE